MLGNSSHTNLIVSIISMPLSCLSWPLPTCRGQAKMMTSEEPAGERNTKSLTCGVAILRNFRTLQCCSRWQPPLYIRSASQSARQPMGSNSGCCYDDFGAICCWCWYLIYYIDYAKMRFRWECELYERAVGLLGLRACGRAGIRVRWYSDGRVSVDGAWS